MVDFGALLDEERRRRALADRPGALAYTPLPSGHAWADRHADYVRDTVRNLLRSACDVRDHLGRLDRLAGPADDLTAMKAAVAPIVEWARGQRAALGDDR